jgi:hypothetical protein
MAAKLIKIGAQKKYNLYYMQFITYQYCFPTVIYMQ